MLEKNANENAARTLILTSLAAAAAGDSHPDDIKNNQEKGISTCIDTPLSPRQTMPCIRYPCDTDSMYSIHSAES